jgi:hypothetical protein
LKTGRKKPISKFRGHEITKLFDVTFEYSRLDRFLFKIGFTKKTRQRLMSQQRPLVEALYKEFIYFEKMRTQRKPAKLPDGINQPAIFNMRRFLYHFPQALVKRELRPLTERQLFKLMQSFTASSRDLKWKSTYKPRLMALQDHYLKLLETLSGGTRANLLAVIKRSKIINRPDRVTGNAIDISVREILNWREDGIPDEQIQRILETFIQYQNLVPRTDRPDAGPNRVLRLPNHNRLLNSLMAIVYDYSEDV